MRARGGRHHKIDEDPVGRLRRIEGRACRPVLEEHLLDGAQGRNVPHVGGGIKDRLGLKRHRAPAVNHVALAGDERNFNHFPAVRHEGRCGEIGRSEGIVAFGRMHEAHRELLQDFRRAGNAGFERLNDEVGRLLEADRFRLAVRADHEPGNAEKKGRHEKERRPGSPERALRDGREPVRSVEILEGVCNQRVRALSGHDECRLFRCSNG